LDEILITEYDPRWPGLFTQEATCVRSVLPADLVTRIEHFGSTAVPGLAAKPVIDLLVGVRSLTEAKRYAIDSLVALGYAYWDTDPDPNHMFFVKGLPPNGPRSHHIHMVEPDSPYWQRLLFRDYLRRDPDEAERYHILKRELAARFAEDREAYTEAKGDYIRRVTEIAQEQATRRR
jgi:GrpB-like predicted nucleotidyltransferase (UPF0157 family)